MKRVSEGLSEMVFKLKPKGYECSHTGSQDKGGGRDLGVVAG